MNGGAMLIVEGLAFWPVIRWYIARIGNSPDDSCALIPLAILLALSILRWRNSTMPGHVLWLATALLVLYILALDRTLPLVRASLMVMTVTMTLSRVLTGSLFNVGICTLGMLSLPVIPSLQFYLGYPLRLVATKCTTLLLGLSGFNVVQEGVVLKMGSLSVLVDGPCSGINMLWTGVLFSALCALRFNLGCRSSLLLLTASIGIVLAGNVLRAMSLFLSELNILPAPAWFHSGAGIVAFLLVLTCIHISAQSLFRLAPCRPSPAS